MTSSNYRCSNSLFLEQEDDEFPLTKDKHSESPSKFRDLVTSSSSIMNRPFSANSIPLSNVRARTSSACYGKEQSSFDDNSTGSSSGTDKSELSLAKSNYRIMLLGENKSGKTSIVKQFLYDKFSERYKETMDDMYRGEFDIYGKTIGFDIQDVSGGYIYEFPGMRDVSITSSDAFILVFSFDSYESWEEVGKLRDMIQVDKGDDIPIVVVGNKSDLRSMADPRIPVESLEAIVTFDWENGYVECSAKERFNINKIFKELLQQSKARYYFEASATATTTTQYGVNPLVHTNCFRTNHSSMKVSPGNNNQTQSIKGSTTQKNHDVLKRRQSLPVVCPSNVLEKIAENVEVGASFCSPSSRKKGMLLHGLNERHSNLPELGGVSNASKGDDNSISKHRVYRRASVAALRKDSCKVS